MLSNKKNLVSFFLIMFGVLVMGRSSYAVDSATAVQRDGVTICLKNIWCKPDGSPINAACAQTDSPFRPVHRVLFGPDNSISESADWILQETVRSGAGKVIQIPLPRDSSGKIPTTEVRWNVGGSNPFFQNAFLKACDMSYAGYIKGQDRITSPQTPIASDIKQKCESKWNKFVEDMNLIIPDSGVQSYIFQGIYEKSSPSSLVVRNEINNLSSSYEWASETANVTGRYISAYRFTDPQTPVEGGGSSNKVGQLGFAPVNATCTIAQVSDPYGQVFSSDPNSAGYLMPIEDVWIALYQKDDLSNIFKLYTIEPPQRTSSFGGFSFALTEGDYKMLVAKGNGTNTAPPFSTDLPAVLSPSETIIDVNSSNLPDPYRMSVEGKPETLYGSMYKANTSDMAPTFHEDGVNLLKLNIATKVVESKEPDSFSFSCDADAVGVFRCSGFATKPYAVVKVKIKQREIYKMTATKTGAYSFLIDPIKDFKAGEGIRDLSLEMSFPTINTTTTQNVFGRQLAGFINQIFDPLNHTVYASNSIKYAGGDRPGYVEGYAYDNVGNLLKNHKVIVVDKRSYLASFETKSDDNGYFIIRPGDMPQGSFYLTYQQVEAPYKIVGTPEISQFKEQNSTYLAKEQIDLYKPILSATANTYIQTHQDLYPIIPASVLSGIPPTGVQQTMPSGGVVISSSPLPSSTGPSTQTHPVSSALLMYVAILLLLIVGAGLLIMYYIKRRKDPHLYE